MIPISAVSIGADIEQMVLEVLRSGMLAQGPRVAQLEREFASLAGVRHVVAVNNGTTALIAALQSLGIGPGDEVITSPFTFVATLNAILEVGATARFADISTDDFNVSADAMESLISERTRVLLPVHLYGQPADMHRIAPLADRSSLHLVEDAAQAHLARIGDQAVGSWGVGCFSLYATKNITAGEGGLISTNDDAVADRLRVLRNQGMRQRYEYEMAGNNYRLTDLQAAVCLPQLRSYDEVLRARRDNAVRLTEGLEDLETIRTPTTMPGRSHVWHQYTILVEDDCSLTRDVLSDALAKVGVGSGVYYPRPVYDYDCYRNHPRVVLDSAPVARWVSERCLSLPVHPGVTPSDVDRVVDAIRGALAGDR